MQFLRHVVSYTLVDKKETEIPEELNVVNVCKDHCITQFRTIEKIGRNISIGCQEQDFLHNFANTGHEGEGI